MIHRPQPQPAVARLPPTVNIPTIYSRRSFRRGRKTHQIYQQTPPRPGKLHQLSYKMVAAVCLSLFVRKQVLLLLLLLFFFYYLLDLEEPWDTDQGVLFGRDHGGGLPGNAFILPNHERV